MSRRADLPELEIDFVAPPPPAHSSRSPRRTGVVIAIGAALAIVAATLAVASLGSTSSTIGPLPKSGLYLWTTDTAGVLTRLDLDTGKVKAFDAGKSPIAAGSTTYASDRFALNERTAIENDRDRSRLVDTITGEWAAFTSGLVVAVGGGTALVQRCVELCQFLGVDVATRNEQSIVSGLATGVRRWPAISPDGSRVALFTGPRSLTATLFALDGGHIAWRADSLLAYEPEAPPLAWSADSRWLFAAVSASAVVAVGPGGAVEIPLSLDPARGIAVTSKRGVAKVADFAASVTVPPTTAPAPIAVDPALRASKLSLWVVDTNERLVQIDLTAGTVGRLPNEGILRIQGALGDKLFVSDSSSTQIVGADGRSFQRISREWALQLDPLTQAYWRSDIADKWQHVTVDGRVLHTIEAERATPMAIVGDRERVLLTAHDRTDVLDLRTMQRTPIVSSWVFAAAGSTAIAADFAAITLSAIDLRSGAIRKLDGVTINDSYSLSPSGEYLAAFVNRAALVIRTATGEVVARREGLTRNRGTGGVAGAWAPDSSWFFAASAAGEIVAVAPASGSVATLKLDTLPSRGLAVTART